MRGSSKVIVGTVLVLLVASISWIPAQDRSVQVSFGWVLSNFSGPVPFGEVGVAIDDTSGEVLVGFKRRVHVFNEVGMEIYSLRTDRSHATVLDLAVEPDGHVITLARDLEAAASDPAIGITRYDFRGRRVGQIEISGAPPPFDKMLPNRVFSVEKGLLLASTTAMLAVRVGPDGTFHRGYDIAELLEIPEDKRDSHQISGLGLDADGNLLLTCAVLFTAFVISPEGELVDSFGESGSAPGTFGVAAGIARDHLGRTYVADKARKVVMIFDESYQLLTEIGGDPALGGPRLGTPSGLDVDRNGFLYVTQIGQRGVWVYRVLPK